MNADSKAEIDRIREAYEQRDADISSSTWKRDIYHPRHPMGRLFYEHDYNILVTALNSLDIDLEDSTVLDVGCGEGAWLRLLVELGAKPDNLTGIDLSESRIQAAREMRRHGYIAFRPPGLWRRMGQSKKARNVRDSAAKKIGGHVHLSARYVRAELMGFIRLLLKNKALAPKVET